jgi:hypothetical protein
MEDIMSNIKPQSEPPDFKQPHHSDGSELVPAEVKASQRHDEYHEGTSSQTPAIPGLKMDDEGLLNNFAVEPEMYPSKYPSPDQQRRYLYWGIAATFLVAALGLISKYVS